MAIPGMNYFCEREWTIVHKKPEDLACWIYNSRGLLVEYEIINIGPDYTSISFLLTLMLEVINFLISIMI